MRLSTLKQQLFLALFFGLLAANVLYCHAVGMEFIRSARVAHVEKAAGGQGDMPLEHKQMGRGGTLVLLNPPFFVVLGMTIRQPVPSAGIAYWVALLIGALIIPFLITLFMYLLVHPPRPGLNLPGMEDAEETRRRWEEDDD